MILPFLIIGLVAGAVYGLAGVGLVLTYKTSNVFNFAYGAVAAIAAYTFYSLHVQAELAWPVAAAITIVGVAPPLTIAFERLARFVGPKPLALKVLATVGVLLVIQGVLTLIYGHEETRTVPVFLAQGQFKIGDTSVQYADLITFLFAAAMTAALYLYFRYARTGAAMRAVVENSELLDLSGTRPTRIRQYAWLIGTIFAGMVGILVAPLLPLDPTQLTLLAAQAFGAAALGRFSSLPITFLGGLLIGVLSSLATKYFTDGILVGLPSAIPFLVLFAVMLLFPRKYLAERTPSIPLWRPTWTTPWTVQIGGGIILLALLASVPAWAGIHLLSWTLAMTYTVMFLSLGLLLRTAGQVSLAHVTFLAIGAVALSHYVEDGIPWFFALLLAGLTAVPIGALLAIPAIRLGPLYLALATFGFGIVVTYMFFPSSFMFGSFTGGGNLEVPRPNGFTDDNSYYYLSLGFAVAVALLIVSLDRSRLGRLLRGISDSATATSTSGAAPRVTWVIVFCISTALAAIAGGLGGSAYQIVSGEAYPPILSLTFMATAMVVFGGAPWYAFAAAIATMVIPSYLTSSDTATYMQVLFGVAAIIWAVQPEHWRGAPPAVQHFFDRYFRRSAKRIAATPASTGSPWIAAPGKLEVNDLVVKYGGVTAVQGFGLTATTGRITGLIGPNGAGKTTTFNVCSGLVKPTAGQLMLDGKDITSSSASARARLGLGRTFQRMELFESLSVEENVAMGAEAPLAGANGLRHLFSNPAERRRVAAATRAAIELCEISELSKSAVMSLSTGQRRLVELARCLAGSSRLLLLDEPSSGLDGAETARFGRILRRVVDEQHVGILIVEHDMSLVMDICDYIYVLDFGQPIFDGTPDEVLASPQVRAAYLGEDETEASTTSPEQMTTVGESR